jgi:poly(3-hydroxybutyrate) depolymerase
MHEDDEVKYLDKMVASIDVNGACLAYAISDNDTAKPLLITLHGGRGFGKQENYLRSAFNKGRQVAMKVIIGLICH